MAVSILVLVDVSLEGSERRIRIGCRLVSILVLVDVSLEGTLRNTCKRTLWVSILVLVDVSLEVRGDAGLAGLQAVFQSLFSWMFRSKRSARV